MKTGHFPQFCAKAHGSNKGILRWKHILERVVDLCLSEEIFG